MNPPLLKLVILAERLAVCRLDTKAPIPEWAAGESFLSISRTRDELSVICEEHFVPAGVQASRGWRGLKIVGPLDLDLVGSLVSVAVPLAHSNIRHCSRWHFRNRLCLGSRSAVGRRHQSTSLRRIRHRQRGMLRIKNSGVKQRRQINCQVEFFIAWKRVNHRPSAGKPSHSATPDSCLLSA